MSGHASYYVPARAMPRGRRIVRRAARPGAAVPMLIVGLCVLGLALTWSVAALVPAAHVRDAIALHDFTLLSRPRVDTLANALLDLLEPLLFTAWALLLVAVALIRGRPRVALAVAIVMSMAPLTSETLKPLLAHQHAQVGAIHIDAASWPSGHATAALALVLCAALVAPARLRPTVAALGGPFAVAVGCSLLILAWHMPSDVLGGYLVAALWMALAVAGLRAADARWPSRSRTSGARGRPRSSSSCSASAVRAGVPQRL